MQSIHLRAEDIFHSIGIKKWLQALNTAQDSYLLSDPIIHEVRVGRGLHEGDGVEDVVDVVAEVENGIGYDRLGGGNASR